MGSRRKARILAVQALYGWDLDPKPLSRVLEFNWLDEDRLSKLDDDTLTFGRLIVKGTIDHVEEVDKRISGHLKKWDISRLAKVELAILRVSVYSLVWQSEIPGSVTIDEAIDIVKEFGNPESYRFINGVLDAVVKDLKSEK